jgi:hypothetical protein
LISSEEQIHLLKVPIENAEFLVCLEVQDSFGCIDEFCDSLLLDYEQEIYLYNIFTPNNDGYSDVFIFDALG